MIRLKDGVSVDRVHPRVCLANATAVPIWTRYGSQDLWITAANEAGHMTNPDPTRQFHRLLVAAAKPWTSRLLPATAEAARMSSVSSASRGMDSDMSRHRRSEEDVFPTDEQSKPAQ
jgi:hypothetical protein